MIYHLESAEQATFVMQGLWPKVKTALQSGKKLSLEVKPEKKSREQEEKYHAMIGEIAKQAQHIGCKWGVDDFKRLLIDQWASETDRKLGRLVQSLDGVRIVQLGMQSRRFSKEEACEFIDWLEAWGATNGVIFTKGE
jgi:hypothetical protein